MRFKKEYFNKIIDWFESKFNFLIDITALLGAIFCIFLSIVLFIVALFNGIESVNYIEIIIVPGLLGFFGIIMLFALRITRFITKK